jgi:hypothetical protein
VNWSLRARAACSGLPDIPARASIEFDNPSIERINDRCETPLAKASQSNCTAASPKARRRINPVIETVLRISGGSVQEVHPLLARRSMSTSRPG